jgi:hypothetical protein
MADVTLSGFPNCPRSTATATLDSRVVTNFDVRSPLHTILLVPGPVSNNRLKVKVKVALRLTVSQSVSQSVCLGVGPPLRKMRRDFKFL